MSEREEQTYLEILRCNLSNTVLELLKLVVKDLVRFDYVDCTSTRDFGEMAEFPLNPQLAKLIVSPNEILTITAMLSMQNVWYMWNKYNKNWTWQHCTKNYYNDCDFRLYNMAFKYPLSLSINQSLISNHNIRSFTTIRYFLPITLILM
ncbi:hypothetical protein MPER_10692 [Moniliophthora perniciosa FA553]|nr:hypothetical protein MPER_10692 [Moniliophthora perniciosa FA553]